MHVLNAYIESESNLYRVYNNNNHNIYSKFIVYMNFLVISYIYIYIYVT